MAQVKDRSAAPKPPKSKVLPSAKSTRRNRPLTKSGPKGYHTTGENEYKTIKQGGKTVRMGPNSTMAPAAPKPSIGATIRDIWERLKGNKKDDASNIAGVRG